MRRRLIWVACGGAITAATGAVAAPVWSSAPTYAEAARLYPPRAKAAGISGRAELNCLVSDSGRLRDCDVVGETPPGYGFGAAAHRLADELQAARTPAARPGEAVTVAIAFPAAMAGSEPYVASDPVWTGLPSMDDFRATFPKTANGVNDVRVVLACSVAAGGALTGCGVASEQPAGQGYGAAALALAPKIRVGLLAADGAPLVGAKVRVPLHYELAPAPAAASR